MVQHPFCFSRKSFPYDNTNQEEKKGVEIITEDGQSGKNPIMMLHCHRMSDILTLSEKENNILATQGAEFSPDKHR
jgi:hypothetical protein